MTPDGDWSGLAIKRAMQPVRAGGTMRLIVMAAFALAVTGATGAEIAVCRSPAGYSYNNNQGLVQPKDAGWTKDQISDGVTTLVQLEDGNWDLLFVDVYKKPISATQDGGRVMPVRSTVGSLSVVVVYDSVFEFYTFFKERDGALKYTHFVNKDGARTLISKSSLMIGSCDLIRFDKVRMSDSALGRQSNDQPSGEVATKPPGPSAPPESDVAPRTKFPDPSRPSTSDGPTSPDEVTTDPAAIRQYAQTLGRAIGMDQSYPLRARQLGWQGTTEVRVSLHDGTIKDIVVTKSSGHQVLDDEAVAKVKRSYQLQSIAKELRGADLNFTVPVIFRLY